MSGTLIEEVITRLSDGVGALRSVEGGASLASLMQSNALPQLTPAAHVITLGMQGGSAEASSGAFVQSVEELVGVVLTFRTDSQTGARALPDMDAIIRAVIAAVAGWAPDTAIGVFRMARANLVNMSRGTVVYQIDFAISDQLRIFQ
jgi:hypothetical protein